jgi:two-component system KDP operon response regulator KdpE
MEILVIEDDRSIRNLITTALELNDYKYHIAENANEGISQFLTHTISLILLDLGLPDADGVEVIKKIRSFSNVPIIIVSARENDSDKVVALDAGADDYIVKPFSVNELLARIRVAIRRGLNQTKTQSSEFRNGSLVIQYDAQIVKVNHQEVHLTSIEYKLLCLLANNIDKVLSYNYILKNVWETSFEDDIKSLRVFMTSLRKKIEVEGCGHKGMIKTYVGVGYRMVHIDIIE